MVNSTFLIEFKMNVKESRAFLLRFERHCDSVTFLTPVRMVHSERMCRQKYLPGEGESTKPAGKGQGMLRSLGFPNLWLFSFVNFFLM